MATTSALKNIFVGKAHPEEVKEKPITATRAQKLGSFIKELNKRTRKHGHNRKKSICQMLGK